MLKELLYSIAINENGEFVHLNDAKKGKAYYCPQCKTEFILRDSGKTGKGSKRKHFAHEQLITNCTPESVLHYSFKKLLVQLLERYKSENMSMMVNWVCQTCYIDYSKVRLQFNLLAKTVKIQDEYDLKVCRPDIALLDSEENVIGVIEIAFTHKPEEAVLDYYQENGITLIQINLNSEEDLNRIEEKIKHPDIVNFCLKPACSNFKNHEARRKLIVMRKRCDRCRKPMLMCHVDASSVFGTKVTTAFTDNEISKAQTMGVRIKKLDINNKDYPQINCAYCEINNQRMRNRY